MFHIYYINKKKGVLGVTPKDKSVSVIVSKMLNMVVVNE